MMETFLDYTIERFTRADIPDLCALTLKVWGVSPTQNEFLLKYSHVNSNQSFLGFMARDKNGSPVGFLAATRADMIFQGSAEPLAQIVDVLVDPEHRGHGLINYLALKTINLCREMGTSAVVGFPNQNFFPIMIKKLGFSATKSLVGVAINVKTFPLEKYSKRFSPLRKVYDSYLNILIKLFKPGTAIPGSFSSEAAPVLLRDSDLIAYKKVRGARIITIQTTGIWFKVNHGLFIGDIKIGSEAEYNQVISKLKIFCILAGIQTINFQSMEGSKEMEYFKSHYPTFQSFPYCYLSFNSNFPLNELKLTFGDIDIF
jgi:predicted N-acetyltransferase YhbS